MKKIIGICAVIVCVIVLAFFLRTQKTEVAAPAGERAQQETRLPWVEVVRGSVLARTGDAKIALHTGDEIVIGSMVEVQFGGLARVYFPDGSVTEAHEGTLLEIAEANVAASGKVTVRLQLL